MYINYPSTQLIQKTWTWSLSRVTCNKSTLHRHAVGHRHRAMKRWTGPISKIIADSTITLTNTNKYTPHNLPVMSERVEDSTSPFNRRMGECSSEPLRWCLLLGQSKKIGKTQSVSRVHYRYYGGEFVTWVRSFSRLRHVKTSFSVLLSMSCHASWKTFSIVQC